jgi:hypothetical protein
LVFCFAFLFLIVFSEGVSAAKYVRAGATGSNNGNDWTNAYTSLPATLTRGETYYIADGNYVGYTFDDAASGTQTITIKKAIDDTRCAQIGKTTSECRGSASGWVNDYGDGQAVFNGDFDITTDDWVFDGVIGGGPGSWKTGHGFKINGQIWFNRGITYPVDNVQLKSIAIQGTQNSYINGGAINLHQTSNILVSKIYSVDGSASHLNSNIGPNTNVIIEYSYFGYFCQYCSAAEHGETMATQWSAGNGFTIRWNLIRWAASTGGLMWSGTGWDVYGNVFYRASGETWNYGGDGLVGNWIAKGWDYKNVNIYHNTFINIPSDAIGSSGGNVYSNDNIRNNYFYNSDTGLPNGIYNSNYNHFQDSGSTSESQGTTGSGNPFVTLDETSNNFAKLSANTASGDSSLAAIYRTDWWGNVGMTRGALQFSQQTCTSCKMIRQGGITPDTTGSNCGTSWTNACSALPSTLTRGWTFWDISWR